MVVPDPLGDFLAALDADTLVRPHRLLLLRRVHLAQVLRKARPDDQDVAELEARALVFRRGLQVRDRDRVRVEARVLDAFGLGVGFVVEQDAAADEAAALVPVFEGRQCAGPVDTAKVLRQVGDRGLRAIVAGAGGLVEEVAQAVPLAAALGVEFELVVEAVYLERRVHEVEDFVDEALAAEAGGFDAADGPAVTDNHGERAVTEHQLDGSEEALLEAYLSETLTPSLTSLAASLMISGVIRLRVPNLSFLPSLSKMPHAQPLGMPLTGGRLS